MNESIQMIALSSSFVFFFILALVSLFICLVRNFLKFLSSSKLKEEEEEEEKNNIRCWIDFLIKIQKIEKKKQNEINFILSLPPTPAHSRPLPLSSPLGAVYSCPETAPRWPVEIMQCCHTVPFIFNSCPFPFMIIIIIVIIIF